MPYSVSRNDDRTWTPTKTRPEEGRETSDLTGALSLQQSRARMWRYPPGARGSRHVEHAQEEVFVVLEGTLTLVVGDPPERVEARRGDVVCVPIGTALQVRNEGDATLELLIWGAPPVEGKAEHLPEAEPAA